MNIKRAFLALAAALLLPGLALAGVSVPGTAKFVVDITFIPNTGSTSITAFIDCENVEEPNSRSEGGLFNGDEAQFTMPSLSINFAECVVTTSAVDGYSAPWRRLRRESSNCTGLARRLPMRRFGSATALVARNPDLALLIPGAPRGTARHGNCRHGKTGV